MVKVTGLWKRGRVWQYRVWVPADIQYLYDRTNINTSLKTSDYYVAVQRAGLLSQRFEKMFIEARRNQIKSKFNVEKVLQETVTVPRHSSGNDIDLDLVIKHTTEAVMTAMGHHPRKHVQMTLSELYERYMSDPAADRSPKSIIEYNSVYGVLVDLVGPNTPIHEIERKTCRDLMEVVRHLPVHAKKRFPDKPWPEISQIAIKQKLKLLSPATVNKYLSNLSALFNWAVKEELLDRNPAKGLSVIDNVRAKDKRLPFSEDQLKRIFNDPVFIERKYDDRPSRFWVPLIGFYSGMRLNEICQLNAEDVREFDGMPCFQITASVNHGVNDKVLKTPSSDRVVPVHPKLLELGFEEYCRSLPITGKLFPDITMAANGYRSDTFTKYFQRFLLKCGAKSDRTSFHSFRHNFRDNLRNAGVNHEIVLALGGWVGDAGIEANYGRGYSAKILKEAISKVKLHHTMTKTVLKR